MSDLTVDKEPQMPSQIKLTLTQQDHWYLLIQITIERQLSIEYCKKLIHNALQLLFGHVGAGIHVDILKYDQERQVAYLRVDKNYVTTLRSALSLLTAFEGKTCRVDILGSSPHLIGLSVNSRDFLKKLGS